MMRNRPVVLVVAFGLATVLCSRAQESPGKPAASGSSKAESTRKPVLTEEVRVSTHEALAGAVEREAKKGNADQKSKDSPDEAVMEFHVLAASGAGVSNSVVTKDKTPARQFHGEVSGALGAVGNQESGNTGTTSKSGKTSISVETDHSKTAPSR